MLRSIGKQSRESVESVLKKKKKATVGLICRKGRFQTWNERVKGDGRWECWVDRMDGRSATHRRWVRVGEISLWLGLGVNFRLFRTSSVGKKVKQKCKEFPEDVFEGFRTPERRWEGVGRRLEADIHNPYAVFCAVVSTSLSAICSRPSVPEKMSPDNCGCPSFFICAPAVDFLKLWRVFSVEYQRCCLICHRSRTGHDS